MSEAVIGLARDVIDEPLYGDLDYYIEKCKERDRVMEMLIDHIAEQDRTIAKLKEQNEKMIAKIVGFDIG